MWDGRCLKCCGSETAQVKEQPRSRGFWGPRPSGTPRAPGRFVADHDPSMQAQVERWGTEARRLLDSGREVAALEIYRRAADALPGAPWLQLRTGELARKLRQSQVAIHYLCRASEAFVRAGLAGRAIAPLRSAWSVARLGGHRSLPVFVDITRRLVQLQTQAGQLVDATVTVEYANDTLRRLGAPELPDPGVCSDWDPATDAAQETEVRAKPLAARRRAR